MPEYYWPLLAAIILSVIGVWSTKTPRGLIWIGGLVCSFVVSVAYLNLYRWLGDTNSIISMGEAADIGDKIVLYDDWIPPSAIAVICDLCLAWSIAMFGLERWETKFLLPIVLGMMLINLIVMTGLILGWPPLPGQNFIGTILEIANYAALAVIGGTGIYHRIGARHARDIQNRLHRYPRSIMGGLLGFGQSLREKHEFKFWGQ